MAVLDRQGDDIQRGLEDPRDVNTALWYDQIRERVAREHFDNRTLLNKLRREGATDRIMSMDWAEPGDIRKETLDGRELIRFPHIAYRFLSVVGLKAGSTFQVIEDDGTGPLVNFPYPHFDEKGNLKSVEIIRMPQGLYQTTMEAV